MAGPLTAPEDLGAAGLALWERLTTVPPLLVEGDDGQLVEEQREIEFSPAEQQMLELAARQADDLATLEAHLAVEGVVVRGSKGQPRLSGLPTEIRLQRAALARLIAAVALPVGDAADGLSPAQIKAQKAAQARWRKKAEAKARAAAGGG